MLQWYPGGLTAEDAAAKAWFSTGGGGSGEDKAPWGGAAGQFQGL